METTSDSQKHLRIKRPATLAILIAMQRCLSVRQSLTCSLDRRVNSDSQCATSHRRDCHDDDNNNNKCALDLHD